MTSPRHACSRCARVYDEPGVCPKGHGWLLDLEDADDRSELRAVRDLALHRRSAMQHVGELLGLQVGSLTTLGLLTFPGSFSSWQALWGSGLMAALALAVPALTTVAWVGVRFFSPRMLRARAIARALESRPRPEAAPAPPAPDRPAAVRIASQPADSPEDSEPPEDRRRQAARARSLKQGG